MSTVDLKTAQAIIRGEYDDDRPTRIVRYENAFDGRYAYGVTFRGQDKNKYMVPTNYIICPVLFWDESDGYNPEGTSKHV